MKQKIKPWLLIAVLLLQGIVVPVKAQFDDFPEDDELFDAPPLNAPPPPPPPAGVSNEIPSVDALGGRGANNFGALSSGDEKKEGNVLTNRQRERLSKAGIEDITNENFPETIESFDFPNADIQDLVKAISELTGKNFIIDPDIRGKVTIVAPSKLTVAEAYQAFLSALAIRGFAVVPSGKFYKIRQARTAIKDSIETFSGAYFPNSDQFITRIVNLKHISAEAVNRELTRMLQSNSGDLVAYTQTNSLIITDYGSNIDRIMKILNQLDVPGFDDQLEVMPVKNAKAKDIAELIDKIVNKGQTTQNRPGGFSSGVPRFSRPGATGNQAGSAYYLVFPDDRTNSLVVTGNKAGIERIRKLLSQLDFKLRPEDAGGVNVYYVKNGDATKIATTLSGIAKDAGPKPATGAGPIGGGVPAAVNNEIFGGDVKITADAGTNALVIVASRQDYEVVLNLLAKIDAPRDQVNVEAIIMELNSGKEDNFSTGVFKFDEGGSGAKVGFNGFATPGDLAGLLNPASGSGTILGFGGGKSVKITPPGGTAVTVPSLLGFINIVKGVTDANILSTPNITTMDNQTGLIEVGDKVVTSINATGGSNGAATVETPVLEDATIRMEIKPFISPGFDRVRMEVKTNIKQISSANVPAQFRDKITPLSTRKIETNVLVNNGDTLVLGGLIKDEDREVTSKVPILGDIPVLGWLFKSNSKQRRKSNMVIFLTPRVLRTSEDAATLLGRTTEKRLEHIKATGGRDPYGSTMDEVRKIKRVDIDPKKAAQSNTEKKTE